MPYIDAALQQRRDVDGTYRKGLSGIKGIDVHDVLDDVEWNMSYFPILINADYPLSRDALYEHMKANGVYCRRYFYPLISDFPMYRGLSSAARQNLSVATEIANRVLCLPMYSALS